MFGKYLDNVRNENPLIHSITNYVTANDVANMLYACGAKPMMADAIEDISETVEMAKGINLNTGTFSQQKANSIMLAAKEANAKGKPVVIDPVGTAGITHRRNFVKDFYIWCRADVICGNVSELNALSGRAVSGSGVDAGPGDEITEDNLKEMVSWAMEESLKYGIITVVKGSVDIITDGSRAYLVRNGRREMRSITGTGDMLSAMIAAFISVNLDHTLEAAAAAAAAIGVAGEIAWGCMEPGDGNATYRNRIIDAVYNMDGQILDKYARVDIIKEKVQ